MEGQILNSEGPVWSLAGGTLLNWSVAGVCLRELTALWGLQARQDPVCVGILDGAGYSGGRGKGETLKRWLKGWKVKAWNEGDVKTPGRSSGKRIRAVRVRQRQSSGDCKDKLSSHGTIFASLAPSPVAVILTPGILAFQWSRGEGMNFLLLPLQQS